MEYLKIHDGDKLWVESDFEAVTGVGVNVTDGELRDFVTRYMETNKETIVQERYKALPMALKEISNNPVIKWADPKLRTSIVQEKFTELLGPKDERDTVATKPAKKVCEQGTIHSY